MPQLGGAFASDLGSTAEWMERRRRQIEQFGRDAEAAGRDAWDTATRAGQGLAAATSSDLRALGSQVLAGRQAPYGQARAIPVATPPQAQRTPAVRSAAPATRANVGYERSESDPEMIKLRREQAAFHEGEWAVDRQNRWMLIPALAPVAVGLLEGAGLLGAAEMAGPQGFLRGPLNLTAREPRLIRGDNWSTRAGRRAHRALQERVDPKPNWRSEPPIKGPNGNIPEA